MVNASSTPPPALAGRAEGDQAPPKAAKAGWIPCLDGLRAVAVLFVVFSHALLAATRGTSDPWLFLLWGQIGTSSFFAISGFLITLLLLREHRARGRIDFRGFFARRAWRILPPLWVFLLLSAIIAPLVRPAFTSAQLLKVLCFVVDYAPTDTFWLDHTWSLGATEQFYLFWPLALFWALPDRAERLAWWLMGLAPVIRVGAYAAGVPGKLAMAFHTVIDAFMVGCLLAIIVDRGGQHWLLGLLRRGWVAVTGALFLLFGSPVLSHLFGGAYFATIGLTLRSFAVGSIIVWATSGQDGPVRKLLLSRVAVRIGTISYSLYLWQQPFFDPDVHRTWVGSLPVALLGTFLLAELSYRFVEEPVGRLRARRLRSSARRLAAGGPA